MSVYKILYAKVNESAGLKKEKSIAYLLIGSLAAGLGVGLVLYFIY